MPPISPVPRPPEYYRPARVRKRHWPRITSFEAGTALGALAAVVACLLLMLAGKFGEALWAFAAAFGLVAVGMARSIAQWINSRDDPRHAKRPPDAP